MIVGLVQAAVTFGAAAGAFATSRRQPRNPLLIAVGATGPLALPTGGAAATICAATGNPILAAVNLFVAFHWRRSATRHARSQRPQTTEGPVLRVTSANLLMTNDNTEAADRLAAVGSDVIVTLETSEAMRRGLEHALVEHDLAGVGSGRLGELAHLWVRRGMAAEPGRLQLSDGSTLPTVELSIDGRTLRVVGVHLHAPVSVRREKTWRAQLDDLRRWVDDADDYLLIGDFNAACNHPGMRELLDDGADAATTVGRPLLRTWPVRGFKKGRGRLIPIFGLDHAVSGKAITVKSLDTHTLPGADHLAISVDAIVGPGQHEHPV